MPRKYLYVAGCSESGGVYAFSIEKDGKLAPYGYVHLDRPMYLTKDGAALYALLREPFGKEMGSGFCSISVCHDGILGDVSAITPTGGTISAYITEFAGNIYTANYTSGDLSLIPSRTVKSRIPGSAEYGSAPHPHYLDRTPDGRFLAAVDLGLDAIFTYNSKLEIVDVCRLPSGLGPRHLAFSPDGGLAYCVNEYASSVTVLKYAAGHFSVLDSYRALPESYCDTSKAAAIRCIGDRLYISHRGYDCITEFLREGEGLRMLCDIPCGGNGPRDFAFCDGYMVCANEDSNTVTVLEPSAGNWTLCYRVSVPHPLCVLP